MGELGLAYAEGKKPWGFNSEITDNVLKEAGDVYWYVAAVADALNVPLSTIFESYAGGFPISHSRGITVIQITGLSSDIAGVLKKAIRDNDGFVTEAAHEQIKRALGGIIILLGALTVFFGSTPHAVTAKNLNKLADRKKRGVLQGSGDAR